MGPEAGQRWRRRCCTVGGSAGAASGRCENLLWSSDMDFGEFGYLHVKVRGEASKDSGAEKSMFVSSCAGGDDENSVWWMCW